MTYTLELAGHSVFVRSDNAVLAENRLSGRIGIIRKRSRVISPTRNELDQVVTGLRGNILETLKSGRVPGSGVTGRSKPRASAPSIAP
jgi:hypothetical protein